MVPWWLPTAQVTKMIKDFKKKIQKEKSRSSDSFLEKRSIYLYKKYWPGKQLNYHIFWSKKLKKSYGIYYPKKKEIRISSRMQKMPGWVLDYVIFHELVHLFVGKHNKKFWQRVKKYPKTEKAKGFLEGVDWQRKCYT